MPERRLARSRPRAGRHVGQGGFSLVELMVALVLGLLLVLAGFQLFTSLRQMSDSTHRLAERQTLLLGATEMLMLDVRTATAIEAPLPDEGESTELTLALDGARRSDYCGGAGSGPLSIRYAVAEGQLSVTLPANCQGGGSLPLGEVEAMTVTPLDRGHILEIALRLPAAPTRLVFRTVNRPMAMNRPPPPEDP